MTVIKVHISSYRGANRRPGFGSARFSDGGGLEGFSFRSPARAKALAAKLEG